MLNRVSFKGVGIVVDNGGNLRKFKESLDEAIAGRMDTFSQPAIVCNNFDIPVAEYQNPAIASKILGGTKVNLPGPAKANMEIVMKNKKTGMAHALVTTGDDILAKQRACSAILNYDAAMAKNAAAMVGERDRSVLNGLLDAQLKLKAAYADACDYIAQLSKKALSAVHNPESMIAQVKGEFIPEITFKDVMAEVNRIKLLHA